MDSSYALLGNQGKGMEAEEANMITAAQAEPAAFAALYRRYLPGIYSYIHVRTQHEEDAIDLTQQVFLRALAALPGYRARGVPFSAWLYRIARNVVTDFHRRRRTTVAWDLLPPDMQPLAEDDLETDLVHRERVVRLHALLSRIEPEKRELLALRFAGGLKIREIAQVMGRSEPAVKTELRRTLQRLKEQYDEQ